LRYRPASIAIGWFLVLLLASCPAVQSERLSQYRNLTTLRIKNAINPPFTGFERSPRS
ncbi:MAG: hypothetical protein F6K32_09770, partial [Desertifilum sp. SIO1I2]|nr:hypothetical protein [Desertifilum sp. SIO1I2]